MEHVETSEYERPDIIDYGDLVELTAGPGDGIGLDASLSLGPVQVDLTFSS